MRKTKSDSEQILGRNLKNHLDLYKSPNNVH